MAPLAQRIPATLARLERLLTGGGGPRELAALGEPELLDFLFQIELRRLIRMGPSVGSEELSPGRLLQAAGGAAAAGVVPVSTLGAMTAFVDRLERAVHDSGAWRRDRPLWWRPGIVAAASTGRPAELREWYAQLEPRLEALLAAGRASGEDPVATALDGASLRPWLRLPGLLPDALGAAIHRDLEAAFTAGELELERAAVGSRRRISERRTDAVTYLDGHEPELLERLPRLAVLVQWCLAGLLPALARRLPGRPLHPPATAMLARYPGPSAGYRAHVDNPGGSADNGREVAVLLYLSSPDRAPVGGELAMWRAGASPTTPPDDLLAPTGGSAVLLDARRVAHQVMPLDEGPARWSLALWLNREPQRQLDAPAQPEVSLTDVLLPVAEPPVPPDTILWHRLDGGAGGTLSVHTVPRRPSPRAGIVTTVYGAGADLERWCRHHLELGFDHLAVVFDRLEEPAEGRVADRLRRRFAAAQLTLWSSSELAARWSRSGSTPAEAELERAGRGGATPQAVAARQTVNASMALAAAATDELGGPPLDWLLHLDADELFHLEGAGRGGADLKSHFSTLAAAGVARVRYLNHELLLPRSPGRSAGPEARPRFKVNPALAQIRLGPVGFERLAAALAMRAADPRPYFSGYHNGKSAVAVAAGEAAAGVHGWRVSGGGASITLAGPSVLHYRFASAEGTCRKYASMADDAARPQEALFEPCRAEGEATQEVLALRQRGAADEEVRSRLLELRDRIAGFDDPEIELLAEAGLLMTPELHNGLAVDRLRPDGAGRRGAVAVTAAVDGGDHDGAGARGAGAVKSVGIVGGGTAGYLAALALARWRPDLRLTLIESSQVPVIGVGEATTPLLPQFLHADLGIEPAELFAAVQPTLKLGIRFDWAINGGDGSFNYPFGPLWLAEALVYDGRLANCSRRSMEMDAGKAPDFDTELGYHLDNRRFVRFLRRRVGQSSVEQVTATVEARRRADGEGVEELVAEDGRRFAFDLYLDCSGFRSLLLGDALGSPHLSYRASLFADRALVAAAPNDGAVQPFTRARKMRAGWCWTTPQRQEDHMGYVFSSSFLNADDAAAELAAVAPGIGEPRLVPFRSGRRRDFWRGNVVGLGNAYGFVEPLESTALHMLVRQIGMLGLALDRPSEAGDPRPALNARVGALWDYLAWFLALHYRFDAGSKTPFWRACAEQVDVSRHAEWIESFGAHGPLASDAAAREDLAVAAVDPLWGAEGIDLLLLAQGVEPGAGPRPRLGREAWRQRVSRWARQVGAAPEHAAALAELDRRPRRLAALGDAFAAAGPAFAVGVRA